MDINHLNNILSDENSRKKLGDLLSKYSVLLHDQSILTEEKKSILDDCKKLGLKEKDFKDILKYQTNPEILFYQLAFLESINDNLISI